MAPGFLRADQTTFGNLPGVMVYDYSTLTSEQVSGMVNGSGTTIGFCRAERNGEERLLGVAEIRVFSGDGRVYAAPTLIYPYVAVHHYKPPDEFIEALRTGPPPSSQEYFDILARLNLKTSSCGQSPRSDSLLPNGLFECTAGTFSY